MKNVAENQWSVSALCTVKHSIVTHVRFEIYDIKSAIAKLDKKFKRKMKNIVQCSKCGLVFGNFCARQCIDQTKWKTNWTTIYIQSVSNYILVLLNQQVSRSQSDTNVFMIINPEIDWQLFFTWITFVSDVAATNITLSDIKLTEVKYGLVVLFQRLQTTDIREPVPLQMYRRTLILSIYQSRISNCSDKKWKIDICILMGIWDALVYHGFY